jgi:hypothetical protein
MNRREMAETFTASTNASVTTSGLAAAFERWRPYVLSLLRVSVAR